MEFLAHLDKGQEELLHYPGVSFSISVGVDSGIGISKT